MRCLFICAQLLLHQGAMVYALIFDYIHKYDNIYVSHSDLYYIHLGDTMKIVIAGVPKIASIQKRIRQTHVSSLTK